MVSSTDIFGLNVPQNTTFLAGVLLQLVKQLQ
ncbi:Uncharacterised protein [uncultured archaeon]|nr:Uncharacterised protein [uncultured archaeon]